MKRLISIILTLVIVLSLFACAPDNVIAPDTEPETENTQTDAPVKQENETEKEPEQTPEKESVKKEKNKDIMPTLDIDTLDYVTLKTKDLKDSYLTFFVGDSSFSAGDMTESEWIKEISKKFGFAVDMKITADSRLYSSQLIAQKSGINLDLIFAKLDDFVSSASLMQNIDSFVESTDSSPFSSRIFDLSGKKLLSGKGNAKTLWYNKAIIKESPATDWTFDDFKKLSETSKNAGCDLLETNSFVEFFSCGNEQITGYDAENGYIMKAQDKGARDILAEFASLTQSEQSESEKTKKFIKENVAFIYTDTPYRRNNMQIGWAPLPSYGEDGTNVMALCGAGLGLSNTIPEKNKDAAITFAMLWCARYSESREDTLMFDLGLSKADCEQYIALCEQTGGIYAADRQINTFFDGKNGILPMYYADDPYNGVEPELSSIMYPVPLAYDRAELINSRY